MTAARPAPAGQRPSGPVTARLKAGAEDTALNAVSLVREGVQGGLRGFLRSDRYFKYKALVVAVWVALSLAGVVIAWPDQGLHADEALGARLVLGSDPEHPVFMIMNDSDKAWRDVVITVNGEYRATTESVGPSQDFTLTPGKLAGHSGKLAPPNLRARDIVLRTRRGAATLLKGGEIQ